MAKPDEVKSNNKPKYAKTKGEHNKDIVIAILVTAVIAFVGGMIFAGKQQAEIKNAVKAAQSVAVPTADAATAAPATASK